MTETMWNEDRSGRDVLEREVPREEPQRQYYFIERAKKILQQKERLLGRPLTACTMTFGCQMNVRDSEKLSGILQEVGYRMTDREDADFIIYNTCTVRENADNRLYGRLGYSGALKKENPEMKIAICGCMMQEQVAIEKIRESYRFVDLIFGTYNIFKFAELLVTMLESDRMVIDIWKESDKMIEDLPTARKYRFKSGVNITYGCDNFCSYCIVPYVRGREKSRRPQDILREIEKLAQDGVKEVMLLGQNVNSYGKGLETAVSFPELLEEVCRIDGIERVRFMTSHPKDLSDDLIRVIAENEKVARHLHLPLQSGSNKVLARMNRHYTKESYLTLVKKIRTAVPDLALTTDLIVGFPGETEEDVQETIDVVEQAKYDNAFTFIYSRRTGTPAAGFADQCDEKAVKRNFDRLLKVVQETARTQSMGKEGQIHQVLIEEVNDHDASMVTGRMSNNALVHVKGGKDRIGTFQDVRLTECRGFYYLGEIMEDANETPRKEVRRDFR